MSDETKAPEFEIHGLPFKDIGEVRKMLGGMSPALNAMMKHQLELVKAYMQAEDAIIVAFATRNGIELPNEFTGTKRRQKLMGQMELLCATIAPTLEPGKERVIQESWCADRRGGKRGYEKTWPRALMVQEADGVTFTVKIIDDPEKEKGNG